MHLSPQAHKTLIFQNHCSYVPIYRTMLQDGESGKDVARSILSAKLAQGHLTPRSDPLNIPLITCNGARATVTVVQVVVQGGQAHIVDADESGAFDTPICTHLPVVTRLLPHTVPSAPGHLPFTVNSMCASSQHMGTPPPPVRTQEGFSQGCTFAAMGYVVLGTLRTHAA